MQIATEVAAYAMGKKWKGYVVRISGGSYKQGFPKNQGVLTCGLVCLLLSKRHSYYENWREKAQICLGLHCGCHPECSQLGFVKKKRREREREGYSRTDNNYCAWSSGAQKS
jgi:hypothetical protein